MFICVCKGIPESEIDELLEEGKDLKGVKEVCGAGTDCGSCHRRLANFVDEHNQSKEQDLDKK